MAIGKGSKDNASESIIEVTRIIGHRYQGYRFGNIMFPLLNSDLFTPSKDQRG